MGELSPIHWLILIVAGLVLFGGQRLPEMARGLGRSVRILKAELSGHQDSPAESDSATEERGQPSRRAGES